MHLSTRTLLLRAGTPHYLALWFPPPHTHTQTCTIAQCYAVTGGMEVETALLDEKDVFVRRVQEPCSPAVFSAG